METGFDLAPGFRRATAAELRGRRMPASKLRELLEAAKANPGKCLVIDDIGDSGGCAWKRGSEGHGALVVTAAVLEEALTPQQLQ